MNWQALRILVISSLLCICSAGNAAPNAGLNVPFHMPPEATGNTIDVRDFGATPDNDQDDDALSINAALNSAASGDIVLLPAGVYHVMTTITAVSGVAIRGSSSAESSIVALFDNDDAITLEVSDGSHDITISDLFFESDGAESPRYVIQAGRDSGELTERIYLKNLTIKTFSERAIVLRDTRHGKVQNCRIGDATALDGGQGYGVTIQGLLSNNNWVTGCILGPALRHGILLQYSTNHNLIERNFLFENTEDAIDLHGEDEYANEVRHNTIRDGVRSGIGIGNTGATHDESGPNNWIHNNRIRDCNDGIEVTEGSDKQYIQDNDIRDCTYYGIRVNNFAFENPIEDLTITGNLINNCNRGITVEVPAPNLLIDGNLIINHVRHGISLDATVRSYTVTNNNLSCNNPASVLGSSEGTYTDNTEDGSCELPAPSSAFVVW